MSPQVLRHIKAQTSSSGSSDAEVAELAGASIEDSTEIKRRSEQQQVMPGRASDEVSDQRPSTEEDEDTEGNTNQFLIL